MWEWLDARDVQKYLHVPSCSSLFGERCDLLAVTSAVRYPVFIESRNYTGSGGGSLTKHRVLLPFVDTLLARDVSRVPNALVVPHGKAVEGAIRHLVDVDVVDPKRVLFGFPHPSGANGWKNQLWNANRTELKFEVDRWFKRRRRSEHS